MKAAIATLLMILLVNPQFINASPVPAPNDAECIIEPTYCDPKPPTTTRTTTKPPPINNACQCNGHLSPVADPEIINVGECKIAHHNGKGFFCYVNVGEGCCEDVSKTYKNHCLNYSICKSGKGPVWQPSKSG